MYFSLSLVGNRRVHLLSNNPAKQINTAVSTSHGTHVTELPELFVQKHYFFLHHC